MVVLLLVAVATSAWWFATDEEAEKWVRRKAKFLATLLLRMPKVARIDAGDEPTLLQVLGAALKFFVYRFVNIAQITLSLHGVRTEEDEEEDDEETRTMTKWCLLRIL